LQKGCKIVVHSKANRSEQAVICELSKALFIVIVFFLPKTIDSAVGTEKDDKNSKKAKKWKKKESAGKSIMIRLYPNKSQKEELNKWFGTARWTYNQVVASLCASPRDVSKYAVVKELRNDFVNKKNSNHEEKFADKPWVTKTPSRH
jgi:hypothetical protein